MRIWAYVAVLAGLQALAAPARAETSQAHEVVRTLGSQIYQLGERTGGTPTDWSALEAQAVAELRDLPTDALIAVNDKGRTPLAVAAMAGFTPLVQALLATPEVRAQIDRKGHDRLDAHDLALLADRQTLQACHPTSENPFALVPFWVVQPYYDNRAPYPQIAALLVQSGADPDQTTARASWLSRCTDAHPDDRAEIAISTDLTASLLAAQHRASDRAKRAELDKAAADLRDMLSTWVASGKMTQADADAMIDSLYLDKGLEPPRK